MKDLTGLRVGRLTVISFAEKRGSHTYWKCKCDCGNYKIILGTSLTCKNPVKSCGCLRKEIATKRLREQRKKEYEQTGHANNFKDLTGKHIKTFSVLSFAYTKNGRAYWNCKCDNCNTESVIASNRLLNSNNTPCKVCSRNNARKPIVDYTNKEVNGYRVEDYVGHGKWKVKCVYCGEEKNVWSAEIKNKTIHHCKCQRKSKSVKDITGKRFGNLVAKEFVGVYPNGSYMWRFECDCGNKDYIANRSNVVSGYTTRCNKCSDITHRGSKGELEVLDYIKSLDNTMCIEQHNRSVLNGYEIDIYIPSLKVGIEYNGSAFHATINNVYNNKEKDYHQNKFIMAKNKGIRLISIFDVDWDRKKDKIKEYLKDIILNKRVIYARKCKVEGIAWKEYKDFCDKNHLQGTSLKNITTYMYGLIYNNEIVSVMGFGTPRFIKKDNEIYELHRYCTKVGVTVVGGANKLHKAFIREVNPSKIRSYSDNDFFTGNIYDSIEYKYDSMSLSYYWCLNGVYIAREKCQAHKLKELYPKLYKESNDSKNREDFIMGKLGAKKVYRCGNTKWIWKA